MTPYLLADTHTHTVFSDGSGTVAQNAEAALRMGCRILAVTDHYAPPDYMDCFIDPNDLDAYFASIDAARAQYPTLEVVAGLEADWYRGCEQDIAAVRPRSTYLLGSVHYVGEYCIDWDDDLRIWDLMDNDAVWDRYVDEWCAACESAVRFDCMAHPDLIRLFGSGPRAPRRALEPRWDRMVEAARETGAHVEVNTAAARKRLRSPYPEPGLLERFARAGVPITIGSDAHKPQDVCAGIEEARGYAYQAGYRTFDVKRADGDWTTFDLR